jgi:hypothetical protein
MAIEFDGASDYSLGDIIDITSSNCTISAWVYPYRVNSGDAVICKWNNDNTAQQQYRLRVSPTGTVEFSLRSASGTTVLNGGSSMSANTWYHIAGRKAGNGTNLMTTWLNGANQSTGTHGADIQNTSEALRICRDGTGNNYYGIACEFAIWTTDLNDKDIAALAAGVPASMISHNLASLQMYWPAHEAMYDISGQRRTISSTGGTPTLGARHAPVQRVGPQIH